MGVFSNNYKTSNVNSTLLDIIRKASGVLPSGYKVVPTSGFRPNSSLLGSAHRKGLALDVQIFGPGGAIPNRGSDTTGLYTMLARGAKGVVQTDYPGLVGRLGFGGAFGVSPGSRVADLMHFDLAGDRGRLDPSKRIGALAPLFPGASAAPAGAGAVASKLPGPFAGKSVALPEGVAKPDATYQGLPDPLAAKASGAEPFAGGAAGGAIVSGWWDAVGATATSTAGVVQAKAIEQGAQVTAAATNKQTETLQKISTEERGLWSNIFGAVFSNVFNLFQRGGILLLGLVLVLGALWITSTSNGRRVASVLS